jgi:hypothetical protein
VDNGMLFALEHAFLIFKGFHPDDRFHRSQDFDRCPTNKPLSSSKSPFNMSEIRAELARQYEDWKALPEDQKLRHLKLEKHGLSEQDLDNLPEAERAQFEHKIAEASRQPVFAPSSDESTSRSALFKPVVSLASVLAISDATPADAGEPAGARQDTALLANSIDNGRER